MYFVELSTSWFLGTHKLHKICKKEYYSQFNHCSTLNVEGKAVVNHLYIYDTISWYTQTTKTTVIEKEKEAIASIRQYYAFVINGVCTLLDTIEFDRLQETYISKNQICIKYLG